MKGINSATIRPEGSPLSPTRCDSNKLPLKTANRRHARCFQLHPLPIVLARTLSSCKGPFFGNFELLAALAPLDRVQAKDLFAPDGRSGFCRLADFFRNG